MKDYIKQGIKIVEQKAKISEDMNNKAEAYANAIGLTKQQLINLKDYYHYAGRGWCKTALETHGQYPDRVSPAFKKLVEIITTLRDADLLDFIQPYLDACAQYGVRISINVDPAKIKVDKQQLVQALADLDACQTDICELNDYLTGPLANIAHNDKYVSKDKFKSLVEHAYDVNKAKTMNANEKIKDQIKKNDMYTKALKDIK